MRGSSSSDSGGGGGSSRSSRTIRGRSCIMIIKKRAQPAFRPINTLSATLPWYVNGQSLQTSAVIT